MAKAGTRQGPQSKRFIVLLVLIQSCGWCKDYNPGGRPAVHRNTNHGPACTSHSPKDWPASRRSPSRKRARQLVVDTRGTASLVGTRRNKTPHLGSPWSWEAGRCHPSAAHWQEAEGAKWHGKSPSELAQRPPLHTAGLGFEKKALLLLAFSL